MSSLAITALGVHLPPTVRTNDAWPDATVRAWTEGRARAAARPGPPPPDSPAAQAVVAAMAEVAADPFQGSERRHVIADDVDPSDMEVAAVQDALGRSGIDPASLDFVLGYSTCPDHLLHPNACLVHERLGLRPDCFTMSTDGVCNAFQLQVHLARGLLATGRYRRGLLVQSCTFSRVTPMELPFSPWVGDAATAVVVEASDGPGLLAESHRTDSSLSAGLVVGAEGARHWTDGGRITSRLADKERSRRMLESVADCGIEVVHDALGQAGLDVEKVDFYASHQASRWFRPVTQRAIGLDRARSVDTFPWAASVGACNLPLVLATGVREGQLREGDVVAMYSGGSGITYSGSVWRWGAVA